MSLGRELVFWLVVSLGTLWVAEVHASPLHDAASSGDIALVESLIAAGALVDESNAQGQTPLMLAALGGHFELVESLAIAKKANIKVRDVHGFTAVHAATLAGDRESISLLVAMGVNMNDAENDRGVSPLMLAVEQDNVVLVRFLADHFARVEQIDAMGRNPLTIAAQMGNEEMIQTLFAFGASCQPIDPEWFAECEAREAKRLSKQN